MISTKEKPAASPNQLRDRLWSNIKTVLFDGCWWCADCQGPTDIVQSDTGQPTCCAQCGSFKINYREKVL